MGTWGMTTFENDDASDWLYDLEADEDGSILARALQPVNQIGDAYLEAPECCNALAAAEIIAALAGRPMQDLPENAQQWVDAHRSIDPKPLLAPAAIKAVARIRQTSELRELWDEAPELPAWLASIDDLHRRLSAP